MLTGETQEKRDAALARLKAMLGKEASKHITVSEAQDRFTRKYVYHVTSDVKDLGAISGNKVGTYFSHIIASSKTVEYQIATSFVTKAGTTVYTSSMLVGGAATVGAEESTTGNTQIFVHPESAAHAEIAFSRPVMANRSDPPGVFLWFENDVVDAHEFGHAYANAVEGRQIKDSDATYGRAKEFENLQRDTYPNRTPRVRRAIE